MRDESNYLPISALQHLIFCPRQCALIHLERLWAENLLTTRGQLEHEKLDKGYKDFKKGSRRLSGLIVRSHQLGIQGKIDLLELERIDKDGHDNLRNFGLRGTWDLYPVEFKHGESKKDECDRVQLCAQVLCLEEMINIHIKTASLFYRRVRRREDVDIDTSLRELTERTIKELHMLFERGQTPLPKYTRACRSCSLKDQCMPKKMGQKMYRYKNMMFKPQEL